MSFIDDVPDYKNYNSGEFYMSSIPNDKIMWDELQAYASRPDSLYMVVKRLNALVLIPATTDTGYPWLVNNLDNAFTKLKTKVTGGKLPWFFDAITIVLEETGINEEDLNDFMRQYNIGYEVSKMFNTYNWSVRENIPKFSEHIDNTLEKLKQTPFEQAVENLQQAKIQFQNLSNERALKDAVRDCASAMESIIKILGCDDDIKKASKYLRDSKKWGRDEIVKDGDAIFNRLHQLYPDFRHGCTGMSTMTVNEAKYWADRMTCYIDYMIRQRDVVEL